MSFNVQGLHKQPSQEISPNVTVNKFHLFPSFMYQKLLSAASNCPYCYIYVHWTLPSLYMKFLIILLWSLNSLLHQHGRSQILMMQQTWRRNHQSSEKCPFWSYQLQLMNPSSITDHCCSVLHILAFVQLHCKVEMIYTFKVRDTPYFCRGLRFLLSCFSKTRNLLVDWFAVNLKSCCSSAIEKAMNSCTEMNVWGQREVGMSNLASFPELTWHKYVVFSEVKCWASR